MVPPAPTRDVGALFPLAGDVRLDHTMSSTVDAEVTGFLEEMPFLDLLGVTEVRVDAGTVVLALPYRDALSNTEAVQGGVFATLMDASVFGAIHSEAEAGLDEMSPVTIGLNVNYLDPVTDGTVTARAGVVHRGSRIAVGIAEVEQRGEPVAHGSATYYLGDAREHSADPEG